MPLAGAAPNLGIGGVSETLRSLLESPTVSHPNESLSLLSMPAPGVLPSAQAGPSDASTPPMVSSWCRPGFRPLGREGLSFYRLFLAHSHPHPPELCPGSCFYSTRWQL